ncbi:HK97 family phage prohead protease [Rhodococcus sp. SORGH_AS_0303]|uniref:HK97 family phage prohead protease n=1 Tax=Rhodococcus sp. SORGH_AS_0303 TaxID=3041753 RepID=UPI00278022B9|nr:HK97 family phage prohead protease [Rhodococcus sp. SORGH_AS_0303]MDQ1202841.1 HK97 family phage prohead protease [Rhodococcus sp. SORGH_AS_0303]
MTIEIRTAAIGGVDEQKRIISGLAVPFGQTANVGYPEEFARGAFADDTVVTVHANHGGFKRGELPVGVLTASRNREDGFYVECRIANTARGDEVLELARDGILQYFSVGFVPGEHQMRGETVVRTKATLCEVSLVETPAYSGAVIESVRSAATEGNTDMTPEEQAKLNAAESEVAALRESFGDMERRMEVIKDGQASGSGRKTYKARTGGELLKALLTGNTDVVTEVREAALEIEGERIQTRAFTGATLAENGVDQPVWLDKQLKLTNRRRPLSTLFSRESLPESGTSFEYPEVIEEIGTVGVQAVEGDDLSYLELKIGEGVGKVRTVGG